MKLRQSQSSKCTTIISVGRAGKDLFQFNPWATVWQYLLFLVSLLAFDSQHWNYGSNMLIQMCWSVTFILANLNFDWYINLSPPIYNKRHLKYYELLWNRRINFKYIILQKAYIFIKFLLFILLTLHHTRSYIWNK